MTTPVVLFGGNPNAIDLNDINSRCNGFKVLDYNESRENESLVVDNLVVGIWTFLQPSISRELLTRYPNLKFVATSTTGVSHIDLDAIRDKGIKLLSLGDAKEQIESITSTPELTWMLVLAVWRRALHNLLADDPDSIERLRYSSMSSQLAGKTIGILGFGRIGKRIAKYAEAFDLKILVSDPFVEQSKFSDSPDIKYVDKDSLLLESDVIVICASVMDSNKIIGKREILFIKDSAIIINTARGCLWDEASVTEALVKGKISGVGVDVYQFEELGESSSMQPSPLLKLNPSEFNIIRTAHIGGACKDSIDKVVEVTLKQINTEIQCL